jgi:hypothetical protein
MEIAVIDSFPHLMSSDWVKVDIEGGEWTILADEHLQWLRGEGVADPSPSAAAAAALEHAG